MNYFSEPRKLSDRIIALHGMSLSILRVTSTLRDAMLRDHIRPQVYEVDETSIQTQMKDSLQKNKTAVIAGSNLGRSITLGGLAGAEVGAASAVVAGAAATEVTVVGGSVAAGASAAAGASVTGERRRKCYILPALCHYKNIYHETHYSFSLFMLIILYRGHRCSWSWSCWC